MIAGMPASAKSLRDAVRDHKLIARLEALKKRSATEGLVLILLADPLTRQRLPTPSSRLGEKTELT